MNVVWGGNHIVDCVALLSWKDQVVLSVSSSPPRVDLKTPANPPNGKAVTIAQNQVIESPPGIKVAVTPESVAVLLDDVPLLTVVDIGQDSLLVRADLRPLGMTVFDDASGLHIGASVLANNRFSGCSTAIALG
jgi:hypothetical protein